MKIAIDYDKLKKMLKDTYDEGRQHQANIDFPSDGFYDNQVYKDSKAAQWIEETDESNKRNGIG